MSNPDSPVVANLCMEAIEEMAINTSPVPPKVWKQYVEDILCIIKRNAVDSFHNTLNSTDQHISFTIKGNNNQITFLGTLVTRKDNALIVEVYRKPTHTDRYLDSFSHCHTRHKISAAGTSLHRATNLPNTKQGKDNELTHVTERIPVAWILWDFYFLWGLAPGRLDGFSIGRYEKKRESFDLYTAKFESGAMWFWGETPALEPFQNKVSSLNCPSIIKDSQRQTQIHSKSLKLKLLLRQKTNTKRTTIHHR